MKNWLVGLTGGIGSGKTAAADRFIAHGITTVDADLASRAVVAPGEEALSLIAEQFGDDILLADGNLDRAKLRHIVFADESKRRWLQSLLHPLISNYLRQHIEQATSEYVILVNPLLIESRQTSWCNRVLVIDAPESQQVTRTMARDNNTAAQVENIMQAQLPRDVRLQAADDVITNDKDLAHLHAQVDELHRRYKELCRTQPE
ncbi:MAG: dephospho-CoA kinase [Pseudomonadaceae bacterium]|nr:dephospho-CoA kinase [Pseudomonadaceae bacterium]